MEEFTSALWKSMLVAQRVRAFTALLSPLCVTRRVRMARENRGSWIAAKPAFVRTA